MTGQQVETEKGYRVFFTEEKHPYTIRACNDRYAICTKPFNLKKTVLYTIIDFNEGIRGTEDLIFCAGFESDEDCFEALVRLSNGVSEVSHRNRVPLSIEKIEARP